MRRQTSANHMVGYLLSDDLHRVLIIYVHQQRHEIAAKSRLKRNRSHSLPSVLFGSRTGSRRLFKSPGIIHRIIALLGRRKAHIGPQPLHVRWLNMAGH